MAGENPKLQERKRKFLEKGQTGFALTGLLRFALLPQSPSNRRTRRLAVTKAIFRWIIEEVDSPNTLASRLETVRHAANWCGTYGLQPYRHRGMLVGGRNIGLRPGSHADFVNAVMDALVRAEAKLLAPEMRERFETKAESRRSANAFVSETVASAAPGCLF